MVVFDFEIILV